MSLTLGAAASDKVNYGNAGGDGGSITIFTLYMWIYPTTITVGRRMFSKVASGGAGQCSFFNTSGGTNRIRTFVDYVTTDASAISASNSISTNSWQFFATTFDGTNAPKIYSGNLSTAAAELSYFSQAAPSGSRVSDSNGNAYVGGDDTATDAFQGRIAIVNWIVGTALTLPQIKSHQFFPRKHVNSKLLTFLGDNGTGTQPDFSGNGNSGTVTGSSRSDNPPIRRRLPWLHTSYTVSSILGLTESLSDTLSLSDARALILGMLSPSSDSFSLSDGQLLREGLLPSASDSFSLSDSRLLNEGLLPQVTDSFGLTDQGSFIFTFNPSFFESVIFSDTIAPNLRYHQALSDLLTLSDSQLLQLFSTLLTIIKSDAISLSDSILLPGSGIQLRDAVALALIAVFSNQQYLYYLRRYLNDSPVAPPAVGSGAAGPPTSSLSLQDSVALMLINVFQNPATLDYLRRYLNDK